MLTAIFKSGTCAALLFLATAVMAEPHTHMASIQVAQGQAKELQLAKKSVWKSLLHLHQGKPQITDADFLLSWPHFSPEAELHATLDLLEQEPQVGACRFPARALWLQTQLNLPGFDTANCPEIREFTIKAPFEKLELVFADESVTQPASILGHSFLRISGTHQGQDIEHAVSFYTHAETVNLPKLLWESLVTGKEGLFSLTPYFEEEKKYLENEQRNLWRYEIATTPFERSLIRNHLFELKHSQLTYYFHHYNCATVLRNILGLSADLPPAPTGWSTPKDMVKALHATGRVTNTQVQLADSWLVANLTKDMPDAGALRQAMVNPSAPFPWLTSHWSIEQIEALRAYNRWLQHKGYISTEIHAANLNALSLNNYAFNELALQVSPQQNPALSAGETHWHTEWRRTGSTTRTAFQWIPASHALMQYQDHASAETELVLLSPTVSADVQQRIRLEEFQIFSMKSLIPWNSLLRPWSTQTLIGYGSLTGHPLDPRSIHATLELGITSRQGAMDFFAIAGPGLRTPSEKEQALFVRTDLGVLWRHEGNGKSRLTWSQWFSGAASTRKWDWEQNWFMKRDWHIGWRYSDMLRSSSRVRGAALSLTHSF